MDVKEIYWKWKQVLRRNKQTISRAISVSLTLVLVIVLGVLAFNIYQADLERAKTDVVGQDKSPISVQKPNYGKEGFNIVAENDNFTLSADFTTGEVSVLEKATGKQWYTNPQDRADDNISAMKTRLSAQFVATFMNLDVGTMMSYDNYAASIRRGGMSHELVDNGIKFKFAFPAAGTVIPVQYVLCEDGLLAEVLVNEIEELWSERFLLESIDFLPFFGAGGLQDEGYLLVPDGSGSLIEFNNDKQKSQSFVGMVYGDNLTLEKKKDSTMSSERISMPVFGAKCNENAFFAVITSGDSNSKISASTSRKTSSYNQVYSTAIIREFASRVSGAKGWQYGGDEASHIHDYSENLTEGQNYSVKFFFMDKDEADYSGMSKCYRNYLKQNNLMNNSALSNERYLVLDLIGAVKIEKFIMGIKMPVVTALTTYNDVCDIVKELKAQGVENIIINYIGALNGGLNNKLTDKVVTASALGSKKDFRNMISYLEQEGVILFLENNPVDIYKNGNGYSGNRDGVKTFFDGFGFQYKYALDSYESIKNSRWHLLSPNLVPELVGKFTDSALDWNIKNISLERLGTALYSNYDKTDRYASRTVTQQIWEQILKTNGEKADYLMVHGGNVYCAPYVDVITDVSGSSSDFDMEDQSIPFYQMTFQGDLVLAVDGINTTVDYEQAFLKALETGCSLKFNLINADVSNLVGTDYNDKTSYSYAYWKDIVVEKYLEMQKAVEGISGQEIVSHEVVDGNVAVTTYESAKVVINYGDADYTYDGKTVAPRDYLIIPGGAK